MFAWLLRNQKFMFITLADEDAASARLRMLRDGPRDSSRGVEDHTGSTKPIELTEDDKVVLGLPSKPLKNTESGTHSPSLDRSNIGPVIIGTRRMRPIYGSKKSAALDRVTNSLGRSHAHDCFVRYVTMAGRCLGMHDLAGRMKNKPS